MEKYFIIGGIVLVLAVVLAIIFAGCSRNRILDRDGMVNSYRQITQDEAKEMMKKDDGHVIVDVRREEEYEEGHIPGAILIPNESIGTEKPKQLPDLHQIILVYCRSGRRSKEAAQKLFDMGYTRVYEFGGILDWTGETVTGGELTITGRNTYVWEKEGFGGDFSITLNENGTYSYYAGMLSSYIGIGNWTFKDGILTLTETTGFDNAFRFRVKSDALVFMSEGSSEFMHVEVEDGDRFMLHNEKEDPVIPEPSCVLVIEANGKTFYANLEGNSSAEALKEKLNSEPITVNMHDYGGFEKVGPLPWSLPTNDTHITTKPGDIILYQGNQITLYYDENSWNFTKLASIGNTTKEELLDVLGNGDVSVKFSLEWGE